MLQRNTVAYDEDQPRELEKAVVLQDAISDLPAVWTSYLISSIHFQWPLVLYMIDTLLCRSQAMKLGMKCHTKSLQKQSFNDL